MAQLSFNDYVHGGTQKDYYQDSEKELCNCPLCESKSYKTIDSDRGLAIVKCTDCDLIFTNPRPINSEHNYFGEENLFYNEARLIFNGKKKHHRDKNYEHELKIIRKYKSNGKLLDVGSNMGFFLRKAREAGFEAEGVEPSASLAKIAQREWGLTIHNSFLEQADLKPNNYDVITLIDVFEHVTNPGDLLDSCKNIISKQGILVIKVPNGNYNYFKMKLSRLFGKKNSMDIWDCYEHVVHYTPETFKKIALKHGWSIKKMVIPLPINPPVWANLVGHYYQYPSPFIMDWKKVLMRKFFYWMGRIEKFFGLKIKFGPDLMFILELKNKENKQS
ncbi:MAG: class I SAM-dependent methyltransferase [Bacteroidales bacterium]